MAVPTKRSSGRLLVLLVAAVVAACGTSPDRPVPPVSAPDAADIPDAVPRDEPLSRYGNPESYVVNGQRYHTLKTSRGFVQRGIASWYGRDFHGRRTSSGEIYDMYQMTAAHTQLPLPTYVEVVNLTNGRSAVVKVNDRGPFHDNRVIDLSYAAALKLDMVGPGTAVVEVRAISNPRDYRQQLPQIAALPSGFDAEFYLQVGAFRDLPNAEKLHTLLRERVAFAGVRVLRSIEGEGTLYRVQLGPFSEVTLADAVVSALNRIGIRDHFLVMN